MNFKKNSTGSGLSYAIIGLGRFGTALAIELANRGREILVIDADEERVRCLRTRSLFCPGSSRLPAGKKPVSYKFSPIQYALAKIPSVRF